MPDKSRVKKGPPSPEQLPQGGATEVNAGLDIAEELSEGQDALEVPGPPEGVTLQEPPDAGGPADEDEEILFGPTSRPTEAVTVGMRPSRRLPPPDDIMEWLPDLVDASRHPSAPRQLRILVELITGELGR